MSFLESVRANRNIGAGVASSASPNPFTSTIGAKPVAKPSNPFAAKTGAPAMPIKPSNPGTAPLGLNKPAMPTKRMTPSTVKPAVSSTLVAATVDEPKSVATEELVNDIKEVKVEVPTEEVKKEEPVTEDKVETKEVVTEEKPAEEVKTKTKTERKRTSKKKETVKTKVVNEQSEEVAETVEKLFKMPTTAMSYAEAIQSLTRNLYDQEWEDWRKELIEECDAITIESDMQEGAIKKTIAKLNSLRDRVWVQFNDTKVIFESLSSKDTEGYIERVKFASLEGSNETSRKKAAVLAVMNHRNEEGKLINLYEVYDQTKARYTFLKSLMDAIQYKSNILITTMSAVKSQKNGFGN